MPDSRLTAVSHPDRVFPTLTPAQIARVARHGQRRPMTSGEVLAAGEHDSDDHQHGAKRTTHRESVDDRTERANMVDDDGRDDLPGHDETDRIADAEPRREKRDRDHV